MSSLARSCIATHRNARPEAVSMKIHRAERDAPTFLLARRTQHSMNCTLVIWSSRKRQHNVSISPSNVTRVSLRWLVCDSPIARRRRRPTSHFGSSSVSDCPKETRIVQVCLNARDFAMHCPHDCTALPARCAMGEPLKRRRLEHLLLHLRRS